MQTIVPQFGCQAATCEVVFPPDVEVYNLQTNGIYNTGTLTFVVDCPPGYACAPGEFPKVVTYPPGTFVIPDPVNNGFPIIIQLQGCLSNIFRQLPANSSQAAINAAAQAVIAEVAAQQAQCDSISGGDGPAPNPKPGFLNQAISDTVACDEGSELTYSATLPSYLTLDVAHSRVVMAVGQIGGLTQAEANASAQTFLDNWVNTEVLADRLTCETCEITTASPLPGGVIGDFYSETLAVTDLSGTPTWSITDGSLPDGLTLDSATGEISGTPTTNETQDFTVQVTNGIRICEKDFSLTVATASPLHFSDLVWTVLIPGTPGLDEVIAPNDIPNDFIVYCIAAGDTDASSVGAFSYTGPLVACNLNVNVTNWAPEFLGSSVPSIPIIVSVDAVPVLTIEAYADCPMVAIFNFPFNIPASVAAAITVSAQSNRIGVGGFQGQFNAVFTLTPA